MKTTISRKIFVLCWNRIFLKEKISLLDDKIVNLAEIITLLKERN
jgi:hypothetical protein